MKINMGRVLLLSAQKWSIGTVYKNGFKNSLYYEMGSFSLYVFLKKVLGKNHTLWELAMNWKQTLKHHNLRHTTS